MTPAMAVPHLGRAGSGATPIAVLFLGLFALAATLHTRLTLDQVHNWDAGSYYEMARSPGLGGEAPFAYRWLLHELIGFAPLAPRRTYELFTWLCLAGTAVLLLRLLEQAGVRPFTAACLVLLGFVWARWGGRFYVWYRAASEPFGYLLIAAGFLAAHRRRLVLVCVLAVVGTACREQALLLIPYYALLHRRAAVLVGLVPGLAVLLGIRALTPVDNYYSILSVGKLALRVKLGSPAEIIRLLACFLTFAGLASTVLLLRGRSALSLFRRSPHLLFWIGANIGLGIIGGTDTDRLMFYAFPAVLLAVGIVSQGAPLPALAAAVLALGQVAISDTFAPIVRAANVFGIWNIAMWVVWTILAGGALWLGRARGAVPIPAGVSAAQPQPVSSTLAAYGEGYSALAGNDAAVETGPP